MNVSTQVPWLDGGLVEHFDVEEIKSANGDTNYVRTASTQTCQKTETKIVTENIDVGKAYHTRFACRKFSYFLHKVLKMKLIMDARASSIQGQAIDESTDVTFVSAMIQYISCIKHGRV